MVSQRARAWANRRGEEAGCAALSSVIICTSPTEGSAPRSTGRWSLSAGELGNLGVPRAEPNLKALPDRAGGLEVARGYCARGGAAVGPRAPHPPPPDHGRVSERVTTTARQTQGSNCSRLNSILFQVAVSCGALIEMLRRGRYRESVGCSNST